MIVRSWMQTYDPNFVKQKEKMFYSFFKYIVRKYFSSLLIKSWMIKFLFCYIMCYSMLYFLDRLISRVASVKTYFLTKWKHLVSYGLAIALKNAVETASPEAPPAPSRLSGVAPSSLMGKFMIEQWAIEHEKFHKEDWITPSNYGCVIFYIAVVTNIF